MQDNIELVREANRKKIEKVMNELEVVDYDTAFKMPPQVTC